VLYAWEAILLLRGLHLGHLELPKSPWLQGVLPLQQGLYPKNMAKNPIICSVKLQNIVHLGPNPTILFACGWA